MMSQCNNCKKDIEKDSYGVKRNKNNYCNKQCFYEAMIIKVKVRCFFCDKEFEKCPSVLKQLQDKKQNAYCSKKCYIEGQKKPKEKIRREKHWNWQGGVNRLQLTIRKSCYGKAWILEVFERDNFTCQKCGQIGGLLHAHHIIYFRFLYNEFLSQYDKNKDLYQQILNFSKFWDLKNGKTLCKQCHRQIHKKNLLIT